MAATIFKDCKIGKVIIPDFSHASFSSESKTITLALKVTAAQKEELEAICASEHIRMSDCLNRAVCMMLSYHDSK